MSLIHIIVPVFCSVAFILFAFLIYTLIFKPVKPFRIAGFTIQGLLPAQMPAMITMLKAEALHAFPSFEEIENKISNPENTEKILPLADAHLDHFLRNKLSEKLPMISMFVGDRTINNLKSVFLDELKELFPSAIKSFASGLKKDYVPEDIINKALGPDIESKTTTVLKAALRKNISGFYFFSGTFGFITGLFIDGILLLNS